MRDLPAQQRVRLGVDRLRVDDALEQPGRRAVDEALELGRAEDGAAAELRQHGRVAEARVAPEREPRALEAARPPVGVGERERELGRLVARRREPRQGAQPLALGRGRLDRPGELGERPAAGRALDVLRQERRRGLLPERARLERAAVVRRGLTDEVEPPDRAGAGGVEEVAVAADRVRAARGGRRARAAARRRGTGSSARDGGASPPRARARIRCRTFSSGRAGGRARRSGQPRRPAAGVPPASRAPRAHRRRRVAHPAPPRARRARRAGRPRRRSSAGRAGPGRRRAARRDRMPHRTSAGSTARTPASGVSASRRSRSATSGASRRRSVSSSTRPGSSTARPRSLPSAKSTPVRGTAE